MVIHNAYDKRESLEKAQRQNLKYLKLLYYKNKITKIEIKELLNEAVEDEEYEVSVLIRDFLDSV